jgi:hypothetical protein
MQRAEIVTAAALAAFGLVAVLVVIPAGVADAPATGGLPPSFMPYVAATLVTAAALGWLAELALRPARLEQPTPGRGQWSFVAAVVLLLASSLALMGSLGFVPGGALLVGGTLTLARSRPATIAAFAVATPLALWLVFARLLSIPLP